MDDGDDSDDGSYPPLDEFSFGWRVAEPAAESQDAAPGGQPATVDTRPSPAGARHGRGTDDCASEPQPPAPEPRPPQPPTARVFGFSDLHVDYADNYQWCEALSPERFQRDVLLLAGDLTDDLAKLRAVLVLLGL